MMRCVFMGILALLERFEYYLLSKMCNVRRAAAMEDGDIKQAC